MTTSDPADSIQPTDAEQYAFVSYSRRDQLSVVEQIAQMRSWGYRIWFDEGIRPTEEWPEELATALSKCALVILFVTKHSVESRNVRNEVNFALTKNRPILTIYLRRTELAGGLELRIGDIQAIRKPELSSAKYKQMVQDALAAALGPQQPGPAQIDTSDTPTEPEVDLGLLGM